MNILTPQSIPRDIAVFCALLIPTLISLMLLNFIQLPFNAEIIPTQLRNPFVMWFAAIIPAFIWGYCLGYIMQFLLLKSRKFHWKALVSLFVIAASFWYAAILYNQYETAQATDLTDIGAEYQMILKSNLSEGVPPKEGQVYVQREGVYLKYMLKNFNGETFSGTINMKIDDFWMTNGVLQKYKYHILQLLVDRNEITSINRSFAPIQP